MFYGNRLFKRAIYPIPELIQAKEWKVEQRDDQARIPTSRGTASMEVYTEEHPRTEALRLVQMGKIKFGPKMMTDQSIANLGDDVQKELVVLLEEVRIRERLQQAGLAAEIAEAGPVAQVPLTSSDNVSALTVHLLSAFGDKSYPKLRHQLLTDDEIGKPGKMAVKIVDWALDALTKGPRKPSFHRTVAVAREMSKVIHVEPNQKGGLAPIKTSANDKASPPKPAQWGKLLRVKEPARTVTIPNSRRTPVVRSDEYGAIMRTPYRVTIDQKIFRKVQRDRKGTVLVDLSLSMALSAEQIHAIVEAARGATICSYAGDSRDAEICVLARDGKRVSDLVLNDPHNGWDGNNADRPVLEWLGRQEAPRIWVTDGKATGPGHEHTEAHVAEAAMVCDKYQIRPVRTAEEARKMLARRTYRRCA